MNEALNALRGLIAAVADAPAGSAKRAGLLVALGTAVASSDALPALIDGAQAMQAALARAMELAAAADADLASEIALREATEATLATVQGERDAAVIERDRLRDEVKALEAIRSTLEAQASSLAGQLSANADQYEATLAAMVTDAEALEAEFMQDVQRLADLKRDHAALQAPIVSRDEGMAKIADRAALEVDRLAALIDRIVLSAPGEPEAG